MSINIQGNVFCFSLLQALPDVEEPSSLSRPQETLPQGWEERQVGYILRIKHDVDIDI